MNPISRLLTTFLVAMAAFTTASRAEVTVSNVTVAQRPGTKLVDIRYDVASTAASTVAVTLEVKNAGVSITATSLTGAVGAGVATGTGKTMVWDMGADWNGNVAAGVAFNITADDGVAPVPDGMVLVQGGTLPDIGNGVLNVATFSIGKYEVTWGEWKTVRDWAATHGYDIGSVGSGAGDNYPVFDVNWYHCVKWCNARSEKESRTPVYTVGGTIYRSGQNDSVVVNATANGYRLPTDAEWEFAARGGTRSQGYTYSGSNDLNAVAWYSDNSGGGPHVVGTKAANELGLYDMSGNAWEWCFEWYPGYAGSARVFRGGGWYDYAGYCRVADRSYGYPGNGISIIGFRAARSSVP